jgi:hypothetical protein
LTAILVCGGDALAFPERAETLFLAGFLGQAHLGIRVPARTVHGCTATIRFTRPGVLAVLVADRHAFAILVAASSQSLALIRMFSAVFVA